MQSTVYHTLEPVFSPQSRVLILGSIPSPKSRETGFYYGHPQNRFWRVLAEVFGESLPQTNEQKAAFVMNRRLALWDVLAECTIDGASDASIKQPIPNKISELIKVTQINAVFTTGKKAFDLYRRLCERDTGIPAVCLPSTSPANCACSFDKLVTEYTAIKTAAEK